MGKPRTTTPRISNLTVWGLLWANVDLLSFSFLLNVINRVSGLVWAYLSKYLVDDVILRRSQPTLVALVSVGALVTVIQGASAYLLARNVNLHAQRAVADLRKRIYSHVLHLPLTYYDANKTGALVSRVMSDVEGIRNILSGGVASFLGAVATACIAFIVLIRINPVMTLVVFSVTAPFGILARKVLNKYQPVFKEANVLRSEVVGRLTESFGGVRIIKACRSEPEERATFGHGIDRLLQNVTITTKAFALLDLINVLGFGIIVAVVMYFGGVGVIEGKMTLGDLLRYVMFLGMLMSPIIQVVSIGTQFSEAYAGLERVRELLAEPREDQDKSRSARVRQLRGEVCFESVSFAYGDNPAVLHDINFQAAPGTITALVGPSGAGKSTIIGLIASFYKPAGGTIWVDGVDLSCVDLDSYRAQLGIVAQDTFLFSGTIRENVALGRPNATSEEIVRACRLARVDEFADRLENSYETVVGERGIKLSMGQRQRVAIARAILANPRILILDEATSSLDSVSEAAIQGALSFLLRDRTTFVIAHRLSTIYQADQILIIDNGQIVEAGTHDSLLRARGKYWELYTMQHSLQSNLLIVPGESQTQPCPI